jgi:outer membrane murein-binding lipoprotein Lpp
MIWIVVGAVVLGGLVVLGLAAWSVVSRLPALRRAQARLERRAAQAQALQESMQALQEQMLVLQEQSVAARSNHRRH